MDFERAVQALCDAEVDFVIVGGVAAMLHGSAHFTNDLDIFYSRIAANLKKLKGALAAFHPRPRGFPDNLPFVWDEATLRNATVLTLRTDLGEIDLLAEVSGLGTYQEVKAQSQVVEAFGRKVTTIDLPSLIRAKRAAGREKDLSMIPELESLMEAEEKN
jgi:predicted nucleotidyltransferase